MFIVWHFTKDKIVAQLQGVFDSEQLAQQSCSVGDCYHPIELNKTYLEDIDSEQIVLYKCPSGKFKDKTSYCKELELKSLKEKIAELEEE